MKKIIIAAVSDNNVIGKNGDIPWYSKSELNHFKRVTLGFPVLMGRKTFQS
ncbi:MAG: dihydrofolate reductase, partial [Bacteroidota bacterium]